MKEVSKETKAAKLLVSEEETTVASILQAIKAKNEILVFTAQEIKQLKENLARAKGRLDVRLEDLEKLTKKESGSQS